MHFLCCFTFSNKSKTGNCLSSSLEMQLGRIFLEKLCVISFSCFWWSNGKFNISVTFVFLIHHCLWAIADLLLVCMYTTERKPFWEFVSCKMWQSKKVNRFSPHTWLIWILINRILDESAMLCTSLEWVNIFSRHQ